MLSTILSSKSNLKILKLFSLASGKALTRKTIKEFTKLPNVSLDMALNKLIKERIIEQEKKLLRLNLSEKKVTMILNLLKEESRLLREIPYKIWLVLFDFTIATQKTKFKKAFLFGSWAKHIARGTSDIDIALIIEKRDLKQELIAEKTIEKLRQKYKRKIQLHFFEKKEFEKSKSTLIKEIKKEAIEIF